MESKQNGRLRLRRNATTTIPKRMGQLSTVAMGWRLSATAELRRLPFRWWPAMARRWAKLGRWLRLQSTAATTILRRDDGLPARAAAELRAV